MNADSYSEITGLQRTAIRLAAARVGAKENDMAGYFLAGGKWEAKSGAELEDLLVTCWTEQEAAK